jgi:citrate synthase
LTRGVNNADLPAEINLDQVNQYMDWPKDWIDRETALELMGVRAQTLYAYVSRGRISVQPDSADPRRSQYRRADIDALITRRARGRRPAVIAASTISWGEPMIPTAIATVEHERLIYRGVDAVTLADTASFEEVAALLWQANEPITFTSQQGVTDDPFVALARLAQTATPLIGRSPERWHGDAIKVIAVLAHALGAGPGDGPLHVRLARNWRLGKAAAERLRRLLVVMADHELNPSTFAVRVAASTGASMAASLLAGLCTLSGPRHGMASNAMLALAQEAERSGVEAAVSTWLARHHELPGFGHPLYPEGDPRAQAIMAGRDPDPIMMALATAAHDITGGLPNCDFAIASLIRSCNLPADAGFRLFALSRSVGWAAHAMEQAATEQIIRPRARYVGVVD